MIIDWDFQPGSEFELFFSIGGHINQSSSTHTDAGTNFHMFLTEYLIWREVSLLWVWLRNCFFNRFDTRARSHYFNQPEFFNVIIFHRFAHFIPMRILFSALIIMWSGIQMCAWQWHNWSEPVLILLVVEIDANTVSRNDDPHGRRISDRRLIHGWNWLVFCLALLYQQYSWDWMWFTRKIDGRRQDHGIETCLPFSPLSPCAIRPLGLYWTWLIESHMRGVKHLERESSCRLNDNERVRDIMTFLSLANNESEESRLIMIWSASLVCRVNWKALISSDCRERSHSTNSTISNDIQPGSACCPLLKPEWVILLESARLLLPASEIGSVFPSVETGSFSATFVVAATVTRTLWPSLNTDIETSSVV
jgi:hypothetical protein